MAEVELQSRTTVEYVLYKLDRTLAVLGIIVLGIWALEINNQEAMQIGIAAVSGLVGYLGGRAGTSAKA